MREVAVFGCFAFFFVGATMADLGTWNTAFIPRSKFSSASGPSMYSRCLMCRVLAPVTRYLTHLGEPMADDRNSSDHKPDADTHQATSQDKHIVHSIERQPEDQDPQSGEDDPDTNRKPAFAVRFIHFLWRRRKWRQCERPITPAQAGQRSQPYVSPLVLLSLRSFKPESTGNRLG